MTESVSTLLDNMQGFAGFAANEVHSYWQLAMASAKDPGVKYNVQPMNFIPMNIQNIDTGTVPTITAAYSHTAVKPPAPELNDISVPEDLSLPPTPTISVDELFKFAQPDLNYAEFTTAMPRIDYATIDDLLAAIDIPSLTTFSPPTLSKFNPPPLPNVTIPTFDVSITPDDIAALGDQSAAYQAEYQAKLLTSQNLVDVGMQRWVQEYAPDYANAMSQLEAKLADGLARGTALDESYENNLYAQARGKGEREFARTINEIEKGHRKRGFVMPSGAMASAIASANQAAASSNALSATTIAIERAKMEVQHIQFVLGASAQVRQHLQAAFNQYAYTLSQLNAQSIASAKNIVESSIQVFNANLERYKAQYDVLETEAALYEAHIKSALAQLDVYRLEIEGSKLQLESDQLQIENYSKLIAAEQIKVELSVALLKSVETRAGVEKLKVEAFAEEARAYTAKLGSDELRVKVYTALLEGDKAKLEGQLANLTVYEKLVDADVKKYDAQLERSKVDVQRNQLLLTNYQAELEAYKTASSVEASVYESTLKGDLAKLEGFKQTLSAKIETLKGNIMAQTLSLEAAKANLVSQLDIAKLQTERDIAFQKMIVELDMSLAQVYGDMASGALSGINGMLSKVTQA